MILMLTSEGHFWIGFSLGAIIGMFAMYILSDD